MFSSLRPTKQWLRVGTTFFCLNTVNVFLGNVVIRKVIRGLYVDDKQAVYEALSYYSGQNDLIS